MSEVEDHVKHPKTARCFRRTKKDKGADAAKRCGGVTRAVDGDPALSRHKRWRVAEILEKAK